MVRRVRNTGMLAVAALLAAPLLTSCQRGVDPSMRQLCGLTDLPRATEDERMALVQELQRRLGLVGTTRNSPENSRIYDATLTLAIAAAGNPAIQDPKVLPLPMAIERLEHACR